MQVKFDTTADNTEAQQSIAQLIAAMNALTAATNANAKASDKQGRETDEAARAQAREGAAARAAAQAEKALERARLDAARAAEQHDARMRAGIGTAIKFAAGVLGIESAMAGMRKVFESVKATVGEWATKTEDGRRASSALQVATDDLNTAVGRAIVGGATWERTIGGIIKAKNILTESVRANEEQISKLARGTIQFVAGALKYLAQGLASVVIGIDFVSTAFSVWKEMASSTIEQIEDTAKAFAFGLTAQLGKAAEGLIRISASLADAVGSDAGVGLRRFADDLKKVNEELSKDAFDAYVRGTERVNRTMQSATASFREFESRAMVTSGIADDVGRALDQLAAGADLEPVAEGVEQVNAGLREGVTLAERFGGAMASAQSSMQAALRASAQAVDEFRRKQQEAFSTAMGFDKESAIIDAAQARKVADMQIAEAQRVQAAELQIANKRKQQLIDVAASAQQFAASMRQSVFGAVSSGIQSMVSDLTSGAYAGEDGFKKFAARMLEMVGQIALGAAGVFAFLPGMQAQAIGLSIAGAAAMGFAAALGGSASTPATPAGGGNPLTQIDQSRNIQIVVNATTAEGRSMGQDVAETTRRAIMYAR